LQLYSMGSASGFLGCAKILRIDGNNVAMTWSPNHEGMRLREGVFGIIPHGRRGGTPLLTKRLSFRARASP